MKKEQRNRALLYSAGVLCLVVGITLNAKSGLGVSPAVSVAYSISTVLGVNLGMVNFVLYLLFIGGEVLLRGRAKLTDLFQLPFSLVFNLLLNMVEGMVTYDSTQHGLVSNLGLLAAAIVLFGAGISLTVNMRIVPNPADGFAWELARRMKWELGLGKNVLDICCVSFTCLFSLLTRGTVIGIGLGTLAAMIFIGRMVAVFNHFFKDRICAAAGLAGQQ